MDLKVLNNAAAPVKDPVCGMNVNPATAKAKEEYRGNTYYFCCPHCAEKFKAGPEKYVAQAASAGLVQVGLSAKPQGTQTVKDPVCGMVIQPAKAAGRLDYLGQSYYFCNPRCQETFSAEPERYARAAPAPRRNREHGRGDPEGVVGEADRDAVAGAEGTDDAERDVLRHAHSIAEQVDLELTGIERHRGSPTGRRRVAGHDLQDTGMPPIGPMLPIGPLPAGTLTPRKVPIPFARHRSTWLPSLVSVAL